MSAGDEREWVHELRNAVNTLVASLAVVRRALEQDDVAVALTFVAHAEDAGERCRRLLVENEAADDASSDLPEDDEN